MYQYYPYQGRRFQKRQSGYFQPFPAFFEQQAADFQSNQHMNTAMLQQQFHDPYQQHYFQQYPQSYQNPFPPMYGGNHTNTINGQFMNSPYPTPYPKPAPYIKQPSGFQTVISQFKKSDGQLDINKMMDTAGQMMSAVNQVGGLFKGVTSMFKS
ncbi:YppG family protein [uncultured Metabacillus sp.]|uniref:YppG family protein n=1 Tax=uncultured Metabacillus sp. TaxID=2860135 RepID=UPI0026096E38|nr:YppG family protein [uncultured Metabacillus sp.]